jgi:hypothetical protein
MGHGQPVKIKLMLWVFLLLEMPIRNQLRGNKVSLIIPINETLKLQIRAKQKEYL